MTTNRAETQWWETMPVERQHYRENRRIPMKKMKCINALADVRRLNEETRVKRNEDRGISVLKELVK